MKINSLQSSNDESSIHHIFCRICDSIFFHTSISNDIMSIDKNTCQIEYLVGFTATQDYEDYVVFYEKLKQFCDIKQSRIDGYSSRKYR